jgi:hypothetical protein
MFNSLSHFDEGVFAVCNALIIVAGILLFAWWISRRPPLPPEPKKLKYAQRLQSQFKRGNGAKKKSTAGDVLPPEEPKKTPRPAGDPGKKVKQRKSR